MHEPRHSGARGIAREPGTQEHGQDESMVWPVCMGSGPRPDGPSRNDTRVFQQPARDLVETRSCSRVIITGWATDFCVDTTVRSCTARGFQTWAPADGHTLADRPHLTAVKVIEHHNYVWSDLIAPGGPVRIATCEQLMSKSAR
jgi:hypothetical protein